MKADILHSGFDGLKFTCQSDIPEDFHEALVAAKAYAKETHSDVQLTLNGITLNVTSKGARGFTTHTGDLGAVWLFQDPHDRIGNRQTAIYDKRAEVLQKKNMAWLEIWNDSLVQHGKAPLDLTNRSESQVWRFEMRLGAKQLRNRFAMRSWKDVHDVIGDAFNDALERVRYCSPSTDSNRSRWPTHDLWQRFQEVVGSDLHEHCSGVVPSNVIEANSLAKFREISRQNFGLLLTLAAIADVTEGEFPSFVENHVQMLVQEALDQKKPIAEMLEKRWRKYRFG